MNKTSIHIFITVILVVLLSCERTNETEIVSVISSFPEFELDGGAFMSFIKNDSLQWEEPGYQAYVNGKKISSVDYGQDVDLSTPGVYYRYYAAENAEGIVSTTRRVIAVTYRAVHENDLSGTYETSRWAEGIQTQVQKKDKNGLYVCQDVFGYPEAGVKGEFVDLGKANNGTNYLVLLNGDGYFGKYIGGRGTYAGAYLNWPLVLTEIEGEPEFSILWRNLNE